jgi:flagellar hook-basal body protein
MSYVGIILQGNISMKAYSTGIEVIGENTSNANTPGYQGQNVTFSEVYGQKGGVGVEVNPQQVNSDKGDTQYTGNPLDVYIDGDGYFLLQGVDGTQYLSRAGMFEVNSDGYLSDKITGNKVLLLDESGSVIEVSMDEFGSMEFDSSQNVQINGTLNTSIGINDVYPGDGDQPVQFEYIDDRGETQTLNIEFTKSNNGKWLLSFVDENGFTISSNNEVHFDSEGNVREEFSSLILNHNPVNRINDIDDLSFNDYTLSPLSDSFTLNSPDDTLMTLELDGRVVWSESSELTLIGGEFIDNDSGAALILENNSGELISDFTEFKNKDALPTTSVGLAGVLDDSIANGDVVSSVSGSPISANVIQSDGSILEVFFSFERVDTREWSVSIDDIDGNELTGDRTITFLSDGALSPFSRRFTFDVDSPDGNTQSVEIVLDNSDGLALSQSSEASTVNSNNVDGVAPAQLEAINFTENGFVEFIYSDSTTVEGFTMVLVESDDRNEQTLSIDFKSEEGSLALSSENTTNISSTHDGLKSGQLINTTVGVDGKLTALYSNGEQTEIASIAIAKVIDNDAVHFEGGSQLKVMNLSGIEVTSAGDASSLNLVGGYIEQSNVDISDEFTKMVLLQRGYQASSHVVSVANSMLDDLYKAIE